ncbi:MAG: hypothetical protein Q7T48_21220 [Cellvibrio sp.]|uniref:hypothetical protein n=1 Tax=Cellvibrio sp. TaxID=1965322 RepID=UPI00271B8CA1|nr:hypothetical protein [Cellvibrio sp.]
MIQTYHHGRFEFFVAVIVIAIIALAAFGRYSFMAKDARILRLEVLSHHFMMGAANTRIQFLLETIANRNALSNRHLTIDGKNLYFSPQGWPASIAGVVTDNYQPTDEDCYHLWTLVLQNPAPIAKGAAASPRGEYRSLAQEDSCRYQYEEGGAYFDYYPATGRLVFVTDAN